MSEEGEGVWWVYEVAPNGIRGVLRWYVTRKRPGEHMRSEYLWKDGSWQNSTGAWDLENWYNAPGYYETEVEAKWALYHAAVGEAV